MKRIQIKSAKYGTHYALVDDADYDKVKKYRWNLSPSFRRGSKKPYKFYAVHSFNYGNNRYTSVKMHRVIMGKGTVDHKNNNGLDNRRCNLRFATNSQNGMNAHHIKSVAGYKGVCYRKDKKVRPYQVRLRLNNNIIQGGFFNSAIDAAKRYNQLASEYFGEFAKLNVI